jgi:hypothetical protein
MDAFAETKALAPFDKLSKGCQQLVESLSTELSTACLDPFYPPSRFPFLLLSNIDLRANSDR